jgi:hypothetical protein
LTIETLLCGRGAFKSLDLRCPAAWK